MGRTQTVYVIVDTKDIINVSNANRFYLQVIVHIDEQDSPITGVYERENIGPDGTINLGNLYVVGPISPEHISYTASIRYLND